MTVNIEITSRFIDELVEKFKTAEDRRNLETILTLLKESKDDKINEDAHSNVRAMRYLG